MSSNENKVEFCDNFRVEVKEGYFRTYIQVTNNRGNESNFSYTITLENLNSCIEKNRVLCLSKKVINFFKLLDVIIENTYLIEKAIGGIYIEYFNETFWITNNKGYRQAIKPGKFLKAIGFTDIKISNIVDKIREVHDNPFVEQIRVTEDLVTIYNMPHATEGTIGSSCMRYKGEYYERLREVTTPEQLSIAYLIGSDQKLVARALLWTTSTGTKIMDRVYFAKEVYSVAFKKWAHTNNYLYRIDADEAVDNTGNKIDITGEFIELSGTLEDYETPYMDTFYNYDICGQLGASDCSYDYELRETDGTAITNTVCCAYCGNREHEDGVTYDINGEPFCTDCIDHHYHYCVDVSEWVHADDCYFANDTEKWYLREDKLIYCEDIEGYCTYHHDYYMVNDYYYYNLPDDAVYCEDEEAFYFEDDCYYNEVTGEWYFYEENYKESLKENKDV